MGGEQRAVNSPRAISPCGLRQPAAAFPRPACWPADAARTSAAPPKRRPRPVARWLHLRPAAAWNDGHKKSAGWIGLRLRGRRGMMRGSVRAGGGGFG
jgi:hypothetical protein